MFSQQLTKYYKVIKFLNCISEECLHNKLFQYHENITVNILLKALEEILTGVLYFQIDFHYETGGILLQKRLCPQDTINYILFIYLFYFIFFF